MFPESGRGLGHVSDVTPTIFGIRSTYLQNYLSWRFQIWYAALYGEWRAGAQIIFPESERGLDLCLEVVSGHLTGLRPEHPLLLSDFRITKPLDCRHIMLLWGSTVGYPSDSLVLVLQRAIRSNFVTSVVMVCEKSRLRSTLLSDARWWKNVDDILSRLDTIPECHGRTYRRTEGIAVSILCVHLWINGVQWKLERLSYNASY